MSVFRQPSLSSGEISPSLYARVDLTKYATGLKTCRNFIVEKFGGISNRPGTQFIAEVKDSSKNVRLIEFIFNSDQTYVLEFGDQYMRVHKDGVQLKDLTLTITGVTKANPAVLTYTGTDPSNGQEVYIEDVVGMTELNGRNFKIANVDSGANTFELQYMDSTNVDSSNFTTYTSGGTASRVYEIPTQYHHTDLADLHFVQSLDVIDIVHPSYPPYQLSRTGDTSWTFEKTSYTPSIERPQTLTISGTAGTGNRLRYRVTAVKDETYEESLEGLAASINIASVTVGAGPTYTVTVTTSASHGYITGDEVYIQDVGEQAISTVSNATPVVVTTASAHGYSTGDQVFIEGIDTAVNSIGNLINEHTYTITVLSATTYSLDNTSGTGYVAGTGGTALRTTSIGYLINKDYWFIASTGATTFTITGLSGSGYLSTAVAGGITRRLGVTVDNVNLPTTSNPYVLTWGTVTDATEYYVYKEANGVFGFIGTSGSTSFSDTGITPDTSETPPIERRLFVDENEFPSEVGYFQQRKLYANTNNEPEKIWVSRSGKFNNFTTRSPQQEDDAITFNMSGRQIKEVRHLLDLGKLVVLTVSDESAILGGGDNVLSPTNINPATYSYNGSSNVSPILIGSNALYIQARGSVIRDLGFDIQVDGYKGNDLTVFATHLFKNYTITDWAYQQTPNSVVWCVRDDGTLLGLTYLKEQEILGWHRHDFYNGLVKDICYVPEGQRDVIYLVVERTIDGKTVKYIERLSTRVLDDIKDMTILDSHLSYDGRNTTTTHTMTLSGGTNWTYDETLTLTSSVSYFEAADVGNEIHLTSGDDIIRFEIKAFTSSTIVTGQVNRTVPAAMRSTAISEWSLAVDEVGGLWHLEGEDVSVFGDAFVESNPNNEAYDTVTVTNGTATLSRHYSVIHVGLPITSDIETLNIDTAGVQTVADKNKLITNVGVFVEDTRGLWAGKEAPTSDSVSNGNLAEYKLRQNEGYDSPVELKTEVIEVNIDSSWNSNGRVFIRQSDPVPCTILAVLPSGLVPLGK
jgi:hypothetical protein